MRAKPNSRTAHSPIRFALHAPGCARRSTSWRPLILVALLGLVVGACEPPADAGTIVIGVGRDAGSLLPILPASSLDAEIGPLLFPGLNLPRLEDGALAYASGGLALAEDWRFNPDTTALTYSLREDAVWSDGTPVTPEDVVFTFELVRRPEMASPFVEFWENIDSVRATAERQVTFFFKRRYPGMLFHTGLGVLPAHAFGGHVEDAEALRSHPAVADPRRLVVSGPLRVEEWRRGERLVLAPNPRSNIEPRLERIVFRIVPEETTRLVELRNGTLDVAYPAPLLGAADLTTDPDVRIETVDDRFYDYVAWNPARFAAFADTDVRRALSLGIDRDGIIRGLGLAEYSNAAGGPYPPIFRRLSRPALEPDPYLPDSARALLAASGWDDRDGDGVLENDGEPFRFTLLIPANQDRRAAPAEILQAQLARLGIDMQISQVEFNSLLDIMFETRDFQAVLLGWQVGLEPDYVVGMFASADHPFNITGFSSVEVDSFIARAQAAATEDEAATYWRAAAHEIARERPYAFLWFYDEVVAMSDDVRNARIDTYGVFQNLHEWSVER